MPWWVKFLRACSRQCRNNLLIDSTYLQTYRENNVQNTHTYTRYTQCTVCTEFKTYLQLSIHVMHHMYTFCQGSALAALSVLSWFNVLLVVLCLNTLLCLCLCLPCVPVIPPPCFPWSRPLVSLTVLTWPSCAFLPLYCAVFLLCLRVCLVP